MTPEQAAAKIREWIEASKKATPGPWTMREEMDGVHRGEQTWIIGANAIGVAKTTNQTRSSLFRNTATKSEANADMIALSRSMPEAVVALVREARGWLVAQDYVDDMNGTPDEDLKKFLAATAPIVNGMGREEK